MMQQVGQQQPQQQQQQQQQVGIHHHHQNHHGEEQQHQILIDQQQQKQNQHLKQQQQPDHHHHQQQQHLPSVVMDEGGVMGMEEDDEDEEDEDDPNELSAAVPSVEVSSSLPTPNSGSNAVVAPDSAGNLVQGMMGVVVEARRPQQPNQQQQNQQQQQQQHQNQQQQQQNQQQQHQAQQQQQRIRGISTSSTLCSSPAMPALPAPCCRVDGCGEDLSNAGDYHRRHKVCKMHATSPKVINHGQEQRFCQQCSRFHSLSEFDEGKRSCRKRLAGHNERRRRHQPDSLATTSSESPPLLQGRESKKPREWKGRGRGGGRRGSRSGLSFPARGPGDDSQALILRSEDLQHNQQQNQHHQQQNQHHQQQQHQQQSVSKRRALKSGEESFTIIFNDAFPERRGESVKGKERALRLQDMMDKRGGGHGGGGGAEYKEIDELDIDIADMEQVKEGLDLGEGVIIPPLPLKRDGKLSVLKGWPQESGGGVLNADEMQIVQLESMRSAAKDEYDKRAWQRDDKDTLIHCFWDCPKVQPVWKWAARQLGKLRGSKVRLDLRQAVFGGKLESWASAESTSVWKLLRGIILWQIWLARKGKVSSSIQWTSNKVIRAAWVDLMMYAMQDWLEVLKKKEAGKQDDAYELRGKFDSKWLVNQFAGKRAEWSMVWKDPDDVLLD